jgi:hypothetical protein
MNRGALNMNPSRSLPLLAQVRIASPCTVRWENMKGNDHTRFCGSCRLNVHNLSAMTAAEAEALVSRSFGAGERLCAALYRRPDGTVLTRDCPVGLAAVRAALRRRTARIGAALGLLLTANMAAVGLSGAPPARLRGLRPFSIIAAWLAPRTPLLPPPGIMEMGAIACPPPPPQARSPGSQPNQ